MSTEPGNILSSLPSFAKRKALCVERYGKALGKGSSRSVFKVSDTLVIKLAHNRKGLAQNNVESDHCIKLWHGDVVAKTLDSCQDDTWLLQEYAPKVSKKAFKAFFGVDSYTLSLYLNQSCPIFPESKYAARVSEDIKATLDDNEYVNEIAYMLGNFQMPARELQSMTAWGQVEDRVVVRDYGLNKSVWEEYYRPKSRPFGF